MLVFVKSINLNDETRGVCIDISINHTSPPRDFMSRGRRTVVDRRRDKINTNYVATRIPDIKAKWQKRYAKVDDVTDCQRIFMTFPLHDGKNDLQHPKFRSPLFKRYKAERKELRRKPYTREWCFRMHRIFSSVDLVFCNVNFSIKFVENIRFNDRNE